MTNVSGNDLTVQRGQLATAATSHAAGASITLIEESGNSTTMNQGGTLAAGGTTLTVTSVASLAVALNDHILISDEILKVTAISGNDLTVERGKLETTAAAQTDGCLLYTSDAADE